MDHWREMERSPDIDRLNHAGHVAIVEAIVARDPDEAEDALRRHLQVAWELVRGTFAARDGGPRGTRRLPGSDELPVTYPATIPDRLPPCRVSGISVGD
jgi:hypothetical protein